MKKRYSKYIRPLTLLFDLIIINGLIIYISDKEYLQFSFLTYINVFWILSSLVSGFYKVYRHTKTLRVLSLLAFQFVIFFLGFFTYFSLFREGDIVHNQTNILTAIFIGICTVKLAFLYALKIYRFIGKNPRKVIVLGYDDSSKKMIELFRRKKNLGYIFEGFFSEKEMSKKHYLGNIEAHFNYVIKNEIDEIYCSLSSLSKVQMKKIRKFGNENNRVVKLIPEANELYNKNIVSEFYDDSMLVLNLKKLPFEIPENRFVKRVFDIVFSILTLIFILSWLTPVIWLIIKIESRGPAFFKQKREGLNGKLFVCYKFRSMKKNSESENKHTIKNDSRVTKFGTFLRKSSLDELPQFFNVLKGNMSVVGPRPHLQSLSIEYQRNVNNYLDRHRVKPGITGLAQVSGYRGEIKKKSDIKNRIRLDIFYIENWSILLDIKIIIQTVFNIFKGEEKAY